MRVEIIDDHWLVRQGLVHALAGASDISVSESGSLDEFFSRVRDPDAGSENVPDVIVLDACLGEDSGIEAIPAIKKECPLTAVLVLSMLPENPNGVRAVMQGASGYVSKGSAPGEILQAIHAVAAGQTHVSPNVARLLADRRAGRQDLTPRESEVVRYYAHGYRCGEIARMMSLSPKTVSAHKANAMRKLGLNTNADIIRWGVDHLQPGGS